MITPLIMLALMTGPYLGVRVASALAGRDLDARGAAAVGLGLLFAFTGVGHFIQTGAMAEMLPPWVPRRVALVYGTGVLEWAIALGFFVPASRRYAGWAAVAALLAFFPMNVYAAVHRVPMGGHAWGPVYLLVRGPLQAVVLGWVYWFTIRRPEAEEARGRGGAT